MARSPLSIRKQSESRSTTAAHEVTMRTTWVLLGFIFVTHCILGLSVGYPEHDYYVYIIFGLGVLAYSVTWFKSPVLAHVGNLKWLAALAVGFGAALASQVAYFWFAVGL